MASLFGAFRTDSTLSSYDATYSTIVGSTFEISAYNSITFDDGASSDVMAGDSYRNERPNDYTQTMDGEFIFWDYTIEVSDGVNTYEIGVIDYNLDGDRSIDLSSAEQGYFLAFLGDTPPLDTPLYVNGIVDNSASIDLSSFVPCFVAGTEIRTAKGPINIETLAVGDAILTAENKVEVLRWIGRRHVGRAEMNANPKLRPVRIMAGALGNGLPKRDLLVSRQHRMLVQSQIAQRMFGADEVLIPAIKLTELPGVFIDETADHVVYFHLLFDKHEVIFSEGAPTESLYTGPEALKALGSEAREEIITLFPEVAQLDYTPVPARVIPSGPLQKKLIARHVKNNKPVTRSVSSRSVSSSH